MLRPASVPIAAFFILSWSVTILAQEQKPTSSEKVKDANSIGIGVALPQNQSRRPVAIAWEHTQLARFLKALSSKKGDPRTFDVVELQSVSQKDAFRECPSQCDFVVVTTFVDTALDSAVAAGPGGVRPNPPPLGLPLSRCCASLEFKIVAPGHPRPIASGVVAMPEGLTDEDAPAEVIRLAADRIAKEVRKKQPPLSE